MTDDRFDKLPKWAQSHIRTIERERDTAIRALNQYIDNQTPSPFYSDEYVSTGEAQRGPSGKRRYFQAYKMEVDHGGVLLNIMLREALSQSAQKPCIELQWGGSGRGMDDVIFQPYSFQAARLIKP